MDFNFLKTDSWRGELLLKVPPSIPGRAADGFKSYGLWNRGELTFGGESTTITDPEDGVQPLAGRQTAENVSISRPFRRRRDDLVYAELKPLRTRVGGKLHIWMLDEFRQPTSSQPLDVLEVVLLQIVLPESDANSADESILSAELLVKP